MRKALALLAFCWVLAAPVHAANVWGLDIPGLELQLGYDFVSNTIDDSAPTPLINNSLGASIPFALGGGWVFRPELTAYFQAYEYRLDRAIPIESIYENVTVLALLVNPTFGWDWHILPTLTVTPELGLGLKFHVPVVNAGASASTMAGPIANWFISGRFLYPNAGLGLLYQFSDKYTLFARLAGYDPVFYWWQDAVYQAAYPWWDQLAVALNLGVRFSL